MKVRYIFVLLFSMLGLYIQAQSIELIGLVPSADGSLAGRKILAKVDDSGAGISTVQLVSFSRTFRPNRDFIFWVQRTEMLVNLLVHAPEPEEYRLLSWIRTSRLFKRYRLVFYK